MILYGDVNARAAVQIRVTIVRHTYDCDDERTMQLQDGCADEEVAVWRSDVSITSPWLAVHREAELLQRMLDPPAMFAQALDPIPDNVRDDLKSPLKEM